MRTKFIANIALCRMVIYHEVNLSIFVTVIRTLRLKLLRYARTEREDALCKLRWWLNAVAKDSLNHRNGLHHSVHDYVPTFKIILSEIWQLSRMSEKQTCYTEASAFPSHLHRLAMESMDNTRDSHL
jgi:hypothetical protein